MTRLLKLALTGCVIVAVGAALIWAFLESRTELRREREREASIAAPRRVSRGPGGEIVVTLDRETQTRIAVKTEALSMRMLAPEVVAVGTVEEDPARSFTLRAPLSGALGRVNGRDLPDHGARLGVFHSMSARTAMKHAIELEHFGEPSELARQYAETKAHSTWVTGAHALMARAVLRRTEVGNVAGSCRAGCPSSKPRPTRSGPSRIRGHGREPSLRQGDRHPRTDEHARAHRIRDGSARAGSHTGPVTHFSGPEDHRTEDAELRGLAEVAVVQAADFA